MPKPRRVALMLDLDWPYGRHLGVFIGTQRYAQEYGRWDCVVDEIVHTSLAAGRKDAPVYDGVIARATTRVAEEARRCGVPVVNVWYNSPAAELPAVLPDFAAAGRLAAEHLLGLGLRRFACLSARRERAHALDVSAFHATIRAAGGVCSCAKFPHERAPGAEGWRRFHEALDRWIDSWSPPVGVYVVFGDMTARHVANACRKRGLRVPEDVALIAGHNEPMLCLHPAPSLSSIELPYDEMGYQAAKLLDALMDGAPPPGEPFRLPPVGLAARQSTNFLAIDDELVAAALQYLVANSQRDITIPEVADAVHTSRRTLERRFSATLGRSIGDELRRLRIERAKRCLVDTSEPIKTVARLAGFANEQRLYEAFEHLEGTSPSEYRARRGPVRGRQEPR